MTEWDDAERRVEKAQELFEQQRWQEALEELRAAIAINPYNSSWLFNVGLTLDELERYDEAIAAYREAMSLDPNDLQSMNHLGVDLHRTGSFDEALAVLTRIERIDPSFEPSYCNRIITYCELGEHEKAEEMFYLARLYKDECPHCFYNIGCSLAERKLFDRAIGCWKRALELDDGLPQVHIRIAEALWDKGDLEQARMHYLAGLRRDPGDTAALLDLGDLLRAMGRTEEAGEKYRRAIELAPEDPAGSCGLGRWLASLGRDAEALATLQHAVQLDASYPGTHAVLATLAIRSGDVAAARRYLRAELRKDHDSVDDWLLTANLLADLGHLRQSATCLRSLAGHWPRLVEPLQNLAIVEFRRGQFADGIDASAKALEVEPGHREVRLNLAMALERLGRFDEAIDLVEAVASSAPSDVEAARLLLRLKALRLARSLLHKIAGTLRGWWSGR